MQAIEFQTTVSNGAIKIPDELKDQVVGAVRVILLTDEVQNTSNGTNGVDPLERKLSAAARGAAMRRRALQNQERIAAGWTNFMREMGISGEPIGAEKLQEMMIAEGINPESNEFSRGIIEMREE